MHFFFLFFFYGRSVIAKIFSWFAKTTKIKKHEIYFLAKINHYGQHTLHTRFHNAASYSCLCKKVYRFSTAVASYFAQDGLQVDSRQTRDNILHIR